MSARLFQMFKRCCTQTIYKKSMNISGNSFHPHNSSPIRFYLSIHEPEYLKQLIPEVPTYDILNVQLKGYDYTVLEHYAKYIAKTANHMDIEVEDCWQTPGKVMKVQSYLLGTTIVDKEYQLTLYERNIQIANVPSTILPLFTEVVENSLPEGIKFVLHPHKEEYETERYIPDLDLKALRQELDDVGNPNAKKKKKGF